MNPILTVSLLLLLACPAFSQKIEKYYDYRWKEVGAKDARFYSVMEKTDSGWHRRDYFIHDLSIQMDGWYEDSACKIASGRFLYAYPGKMIESTGRYLHGKKQGAWLSYYPDGVLSDSIVYNEGNFTGTRLGWYHNGWLADSCIYRSDGSGLEMRWFDNGNPYSAGAIAGLKPHGRWQYFHKNGKLSAMELYDHGKLMDKQYFDETGGPKSDTANNDCEASFPGGLNGWARYLGKKLYFPPQYQLVNGDKAVVVISATIDEEGKIQDAYVSTPFYPEFDKIALAAVRNSPTWLPARNHNRNVRYHIKQPVAFSQPE